MSDNDLIRKLRARADGRDELLSLAAYELEVANLRVDAAVARANQLEKALVVLYRTNPLEVARVCDEIIDQRGGLLGRIRALAGVPAEPATEEKP